MKSTNNQVTQGVSRRSFLTGIGALGAVTALSLSGCGNNANGAEATASSSNSGASQSPYPEVDLPGRLSMSDFAASAAQAEPIESFDAEETYDVVVVGAGTGGVPAAIAAYESGASV